MFLLDKIKHNFLQSRTINALYDKVSGAENLNWSRVVLRDECHKIVENLDIKKTSVLEISGDYWKKLAFQKYKSVHFPDFDICSSTLNETFDLIIAEQVFEHLLWPYRAGKNVHQMLKPGGHFLISTPFLVPVHNIPVDCTRWTELGLKHFLAECGWLELEKIQTGSWGNRACVKANLEGWVRFRRRLHTLKNEKDVPYHVWALAQK